MPLIKSGSDDALRSNALEMIKAGHPHDQAWAAAYRNQREHRADGGNIIAEVREIGRRARQRLALGGSPTVPWFVRNEARNMAHVGPVMSAVPGRTDKHNVNVVGGSYVVPAETVSHLGQSNTMAGMKALDTMFGGHGPYGMGKDMPIKSGPGAPRPPRAMKFSLGGYSEGGARGVDANPEPTSDHQQMVPVVVAGGEYIIPPEIVEAIGRSAMDGAGTPKEHLKAGHAVLDKFVMRQRRDHIKTLRGLKPPVKK